MKKLIIAITLILVSVNVSANTIGNKDIYDLFKANMMCAGVISVAPKDIRYDNTQYINRGLKLHMLYSGMTKKQSTAIVDAVFKLVTNDAFVKKMALNTYPGVTNFVKIALKDVGLNSCRDLGGATQYKISKLG